jgi:hypothetical protein
MCFGNKAAKRAARETAKAAADQAAADRLAAQALQQGRETMIAQAKAAQDASELLSIPMEQAEVDLAPEAAQVDPATGRRRPTRAAFMSAPRSSGITI